MTNMLELIVNYSKEHPVYVVCRDVRKRRRLPVYEGDLAEWNPSPVLKRYGRCIRVGYAGSVVMSVNRNADPLLSKEITDSEAFLWNEWQGAEDTLLFATRHELEKTRTFLNKAGCVIMQELLFDEFDDLSFPDLKLKLLSDEKLCRWMLQELKRSLLLLSFSILVIAVTGYIVGEHIAVENSELHGKISVHKKESGQAETKTRNLDRLKSRMESPINPQSIYVFDKVALVIPDGIKFTSVDISGNTMMIEGVFDSSESLSELMKDAGTSEGVKGIEADRIDMDTKGNRIFTLRIWTQ